MLIEIAAVNAANSINGIFAVLFRGQGRLEQWLPDISYDTDLPCAEASQEVPKAGEWNG